MDRQIDHQPHGWTDEQKNRQADLGIGRQSDPAMHLLLSIDSLVSSSIGKIETGMDNHF
jgi:hypothetical protein